MEMWTEVRRRVLTGELSKRAACREYGLNWRTLEKMLAHVEPPGYRRKAKRGQPVLGPHLAWIHEVLEQDKEAPKKQRHTAQRIFDRLRAERGYTGGVTVVKEAVREWNDATKEVFVPLSHPPGEAQVDFGFASVDLAGERLQVALFVMSLPYSDALYIQAFLNTDRWIMLGKVPRGRRNVVVSLHYDRRAAAKLPRDNLRNPA